MTTTIDERLTRFFQADQQLMADPFELYRDLRQTGPVYLWQAGPFGSHFIQAPRLQGSAGGPNEQS